MQDQFYTFSMFDAQAWYARDVILGRIKLPSKEAMQKDDDAWVKREEALKDAFEKIDFQADYVRELCDATDYPKFDIDMTVRRVQGVGARQGAFHPRLPQQGVQIALHRNHGCRFITRPGSKRWTTRMKAFLAVQAARKAAAGINLSQGAVTRKGRPSGGLSPSASALHDPARSRGEVLRRFRSGEVRLLVSSPGRYFPVRTRRALPMPANSAPATSASASSPTITASLPSISVLASAALKKSGAGLPSTHRLALSGIFQRRHEGAGVEAELAVLVLEAAVARKRQKLGARQQLAGTPALSAA